MPLYPAVVLVTDLVCPCVIAPDAASQFDQLIVVLVQPLAARVVALHTFVTPPTFTVAFMAVEKEAEVVSRTRKLWPFVIVPLVTQPPPLMLIVAPVPLTETGVVVLIPLIVNVFEYTSVLGF